MTSARSANIFFFFFSSRRRHTRCSRDWSSDVCSSDLKLALEERHVGHHQNHRVQDDERLERVLGDGRQGHWSGAREVGRLRDRKSTRLNSSHGYISYAVFCLKKKKKNMTTVTCADTHHEHQLNTRTHT